MPPVDVPWKSFRFQAIFVFPPSNHAFIFLVHALLYLCSASLLSFLLVQSGPFLSLCAAAAVSASGLPWGHGVGSTTKPQDAHTRPRRTLYSIKSTLWKHSPHTHKKVTRARAHTHDPLLTDLTLASTQTARAPLHSVSVWQIRSVLNAANYLFQVSFQSVCATLPANPPTAQEAQREDDKLSIRPGSGEFSSCLHVLCETWVSRPHVRSRGALIWLRLCHGHPWAGLLFSSPPPFLLSCPSDDCYSTGEERKRFPGRGCSSGFNCSQRHNELVYRTTHKIAL